MLSRPSSAVAATAAAAAAAVGSAHARRPLVIVAVLPPSPPLTRARVRERAASLLGHRRRRRRRRSPSARFYAEKRRRLARNKTRSCARVFVGGSRRFSVCMPDVAARYRRRRRRRLSSSRYRAVVVLGVCRRAPRREHRHLQDCARSKVSSGRRFAAASMTGKFALIHRRSSVSLFCQNTKTGAQTNSKSQRHCSSDFRAKNCCIQS